MSIYYITKLKNNVNQWSKNLSPIFHYRCYCNNVNTRTWGSNSKLLLSFNLNIKVYHYNNFHYSAAESLSSFIYFRTSLVIRLTSYGWGIFIISRHTSLFSNENRCSSIISSSDIPDGWCPKTREASSYGQTTGMAKWLFRLWEYLCFDTELIIQLCVYNIDTRFFL